jgi:DNA-binding NarL/FixJ family response regulator
MNGTWIVEDHAGFRGSLLQVLASEPELGPTRAFAACAEMLAALEIGPGPAAMLMDLGLPGMGGLEGLRLVRTRSPETHVLILTAFDDEVKVRDAVHSGASGYLLKTAMAEDIIEGIREVLAGGAPMSPSIARKVLGMAAGRPTPTAAALLSEREAEILRCLVEGLLKKQIALRLGLSIHTVDTYLRRVYEKLGVGSRSEAVTRALRDGLV